MEHETEGFSLGQRCQALAELEAELRVFSHDGLVQLVIELIDASRGYVGGSYSYCVDRS